VSSVGSANSPYAIHKKQQDKIICQATAELNPSEVENPKSCLRRVQHQEIGSILMVGCWFGSTEPSEPRIVLISAPMLATVGDLTDGSAGVVFSETWNEEFLAAFPDSIAVDELHIPAFGFLSGSPRQLNNFQLPSVFAEIESVVIPAAELLGQSIDADNTSMFRAFLFPLAANAPAGMSWPITATVQDIADSLTALKGNYEAFLPAFQAIEPQLEAWLHLTADTPHLLQVPYVLYKDVQHGFPDLDTGALLKMVEDEHYLSPLIDARNGVVWRLALDHYFSQN
jgi:hypothetical protein